MKKGEVSYVIHQRKFEKKKKKKKKYDKKIF